MNRYIINTDYGEVSYITNDEWTGRLNFTTIYPSCLNSEIDTEVFSNIMTLTVF